MKKNILIIAILLSSLFTAYAQEKGFHLAISGNYGHNLFNYKLDNKINSRYPRGWGAGLAGQYFFTQHWGVSLGFEWFSYNGKAIYNNNWQEDPEHYVIDGMIDEEGLFGKFKNVNYSLFTGVKNWEERQHGNVINIPVMLQYQTKWGLKEMVGMYFALGVKFQLPVLNQTYSVQQGELQVLAYYPDQDLILGDPYSLVGHGLGTTNEKTFKNQFDGTMKIKGFSVAASGELGMLFNFSRRVDLGIGFYLDYGFLNIKKADAHSKGYLIMPHADDNSNIDPHAMDEAMIRGQIGDGLTYNGYLQSAASNKVNLLAFGGKATLRIKLGKLSEPKQAQENRSSEEDREFYKNLLKALTDSITIAIAENKPVITIPASEEIDVDDPHHPDHPNNPKSANYRYPQWYTPDYLNEPNSVTKNEEKVKQIVNDMVESIYFDLNKYDISAKAVEVLDRKVDLMKKYPTLNIALVGHTCDLGSNTLNDELSHKRCIAARNYMIRKGIRASRIDLLPLGKHHPDHPNNSEENRALNRRVDFMTVE